MPLAHSTVDGAPVSTGRRGGLGPFITFIEFERPDGLVARIESRRRRKSREPDRSHVGHGGSTGPGMVDRRAVRVGSALFAIGAAPGTPALSGTDPIDHLLRRVGVLHCGRIPPVPRVGRRRFRGPTRGWGRILVWRPYQIDWWASGIQLVGTGVLQREHRHRHGGRPHQPAGAPAHLEAGCHRLGVLPGGQQLGVVRGVPRRAGLVPPTGWRGGSRCSTWSDRIAFMGSRWPIHRALHRSGSKCGVVPTSGHSSVRCVSWPERSSPARANRGAGATPVDWRAMSSAVRAGSSTCRARADGR